MKIALFGYGKMGKLIHEAACKKNHEIQLIDRQMTKTEKSKALRSCQLAIDFSHAHAVDDNIELCIENKKNLVIGTTGWDQDLEKMKSALQKSDIGCLYSPNFALGIALFKQIVAHAARLLAIDYEVAGIEYHHSEKADSPSGTAKALTNEILKQKLGYKDFEFTSLRCGHLPGTHTLLFDSPSDTITLTHEARNRNCFAEGAVIAAEWLIDKKGFFTLDDYMQETLKHET
jgi:4-hydroxy-tetrahydrodipicolinate reductase